MQTAGTRRSVTRGRQTGRADVGAQYAGKETGLPSHASTIRTRPLILTDGKGDDLFST